MLTVVSNGVQHRPVMYRGSYTECGIRESNVESDLRDDLEGKLGVGGDVKGGPG